MAPRSPTPARQPAAAGPEHAGQRGCIAALLAALALQACLPMPHREPLAPRITGVVRSGGTAMPAVTLQYTFFKPRAEADCSRTDAEARSVADGSFFFEMPTKFMFFQYAGDRGYEYELCAAGETGPILLWRNHEFARLGTPAILDCDLGAPLRETRSGRTRCTVRVSEATR